MADELILMPKRELVASERVIKLLEDALEKAKKGEIQGIAYVAELTEDSYESGSSPIGNYFAVAGNLFSLGMRVMGFADASDQNSPN